MNRISKLLAVLTALVLALGMLPVASAEDIPTDYLLTDEPITITLVRSDNPNQPMKLDSLAIEMIEKYTGVTLEIEAISGSDFGTKTEMLIATNNMPDIMYDCLYVDNYANSGVFLDIAEYLDYMPNFSRMMEEDPDLKKIYIGDALYYVPVLGRDVYRMGRSPQIRQDLLDATGLGTPATYDDLYAVLLAIKEANPDTYPIANRNGTGNLFTCYAYSMGSGDGVYWEPLRGEYVYGQADESFLPVLEFFAKAYADGILDPDYAVCTGTQWQERLASGQSSFFFDNPSFATNFNAALAVEDAAQLFAPVEIPSFGDVQRGLYYNKNDMGRTVISADTANPEIVCGLVDFLYSEVGCDLTNFGIEGEQYEKTADGEYVMLDAAVEPFKTASDPLRAFYGEYGLGKLGMARYIDERSQEPFMTEESLAWYETWAGWSFMDEPVLDPSFTAEESEELAELRTRVNDTLTAEYDKFIMGQRPVSEWTEVQAKIADDAARLCEIYNAAATR